MALPAGWSTTDHPFDKPLDSETITRDPRIEAAANALHDARRKHFEGRLFAQSWAAMWPEYQAQLREEAQAVVWAVDKAARTAGEGEP